MDDLEKRESNKARQWLWAARFFKTRYLAAEAVTGGKISINGDRPKPSRIVRPGDLLTIRRGPYEWTVTVKVVSRLRGPAAQAQQFYDETEESVSRREAAIARLKLERSPEFDSRSAIKKRPSRDREMDQTRLVSCSISEPALT